MRLPQPRRERAFTLIEIMIAITIFGIVLGAIYSTWSAILRASKTGRDAAISVQRARISLRAVEDALLTAQVFNENLRYYAFAADTTTDPDFATLSVVSRLPASFPGDGRARAQFGDQLVRRVTFTVQPGTNTNHQLENQLVMTQSTLLTPTNYPDAFYSVPLAGNVSLFVVEFWDTNKATWASEWVATNQLPRMARITLGIGQSKESRHKPLDLYTRIVGLPANPVLTEYQMPPAARPPAGRPLPGAPGVGPGQPGGPLRPIQPGSPIRPPTGPARPPGGPVR